MEILGNLASTNLIAAAVIGAILVADPACFGPANSGPYDRSRKSVKAFHTTSRLVLALGLFMAVFGMFPGTAPLALGSTGAPVPEIPASEVNQTVEAAPQPIELLSEDTIQVPPRHFMCWYIVQFMPMRLSFFTDFFVHNVIKLGIDPHKWRVL
jgi:hypothetical protein